MRLTVAALTAAGAAALALVSLSPGKQGTDGWRIETASLPASAEFRLPGEYLINGRSVDAPRQTVSLRPGTEMMKYQVSLADYMQCVDAGVCAAPDMPRGVDARGELPVTGVNFRDAVAYAEWLSAQTGDRWRLPTDAEWAAAAAERLSDATPVLSADDGSNPAARWLERYRAEVAGGRDPEPKAVGHFGTNSNGFADMGGNVWEWTTSCFTRTTLDEQGAALHVTENCGVRVVAGKHRGYMSHFLRDGKSGGCAAGLPPDNLGIRLVREHGWIAQALRTLVDRS